jgi:hypothetical protein
LTCRYWCGPSGEKMKKRRRKKKTKNKTSQRIRGVHPTNHTQPTFRLSSVPLCCILTARYNMKCLSCRAPSDRRRRLVVEEIAQCIAAAVAGQ